MLWRPLNFMNYKIVYYNIPRLLHNNDVVANNQTNIFNSYLISI